MLVSFLVSFPINADPVGGNSEIHVRNCRDYLGRFTGQMKGNIADVTTADINRFLQKQETLGPVSSNSLRGTILSMFRFAKRQGYLHPDRDTVADMTESFKAPETEITIFTPDEMAKMLVASHARLLPLLAIGAFAGIRTAEIRRLHWEDIKWDRGHIEIAGRKAKTASLAMDKPKDGKKKEHDMAAIKRSTAEALRYGAVAGRKVMLSWDKACIDYRHWCKLKHTYGVYFTTCEKSNSTAEICSLNLLDRSEPRTTWSAPPAACSCGASFTPIPWME